MNPGQNAPDASAHSAETATNRALTNKALESRRSFLFKVSIAVNALVAAAIATPVIGYLLGPIRKKGAYNSWIELGEVSDYHEGETVLATYRNPDTNQWDGDTGKVACYVRREASNTFTVFAVNCAHLGCPVRWFPQSELFMCPCHGGVYYSNGDRAAGPPERGLFTYDYHVTGGKLMINAGQMPTLANEAKLVREIKGAGGILPCPGTSKPTIG
jgi:menaquinol-cytochrome c reductase iron-sulfur subunit